MRNYNREYRNLAFFRVGWYYLGTNIGSSGVGTVKKAGCIFA